MTTTNEEVVSHPFAEAFAPFLQQAQQMEGDIALAEAVSRNGKPYEDGKHRWAWTNCPKWWRGR